MSEETWSTQMGEKLHKELDPVFELLSDSIEVIGETLGTLATGLVMNLKVTQSTILALLEHLGMDEEAAMSRDGFLRMWDEMTIDMKAVQTVQEANDILKGRWTRSSTES